MRSDRSERVLGLDFALGSTEMRNNRNPSSIIEEVLDSREGRLNASVIDHPIAIQLDVELATDQDL